MNDKWPKRKLGELYEIARGGSPRPIKEYLTTEEDGVNWIKIGDATASSKYIYETKEKIKPDGVRNSRLVQEGDFILSNSMSFGRPYIMKTKGCIHDGWLVLHPKTNDVEQDFLYHLLGSPFAFNQFDSLAAGTCVRNLNSDLVRGVEIPVPPKEEQQRIVAILDEAFAGIATATANAEKNLQNARELFESTLQSVFAEKGEEWEEKTLREVSLDFGRGKSKHRPRNDKRLFGGKYPFVQTGDVRNSNGQVIKKYTTTYNGFGLAQSKLWPKGTICITIAANIAETGILGFDACFPDSVIGIVVDEKKTNNQFVEYLLQSFKAVLKAKGKGSAQDNINLGTFENQTFPFPELRVQNCIVDKLDRLSEEIQKVEIVYQQKLDELVELKQSILQKAFAGELH